MSIILEQPGIALRGWLHQHPNEASPENAPRSLNIFRPRARKKNEGETITANFLVLFFLVTGSLVKQTTYSDHLHLALLLNDEQEKQSSRNES